MRPYLHRVLACLLLAAGAGAGHAALATRATASRLPNVVIIITDDQGYADFSFNPHHAPEVSTPNLDALASQGVVFTQAYVSASTCSPTRSGLMLGRYQQRVGVYTSGDGGRGFDPTVPIFPSFLPELYRKAAVGKWHLGLDDDEPVLAWHPLNRGFDECYLLMGRGAYDYFDLAGASGGDDSARLYRNLRRIDDRGYLTRRLTEEAVAFIDRNRARPFFLYLAYNAVHEPLQAPDRDIERLRRQFPEVSKRRATLMAMLEHLDRGVGAVVDKLEAEGLWDDTLLFFLTDNGTDEVGDNTPLRGFKHGFYEGGIRTPLVVSWPAQFEGGRTIDTPVTSLDILPTVLAAIGDSPLAPDSFDGRDILPVLGGQTDRLHGRLFWSNGADGKWAVRRYDWKLVSIDGNRELYDLRADPTETNDLAARKPLVVSSLTRAYDSWLEQMAEPIVSGRKRWVPDR